MPGMRRMLARTPARPRWRTAASRIHTALGAWGSGRHGARFAHQRPAQSPYTPLVDAYASDIGKLRMRSARASASVRGSRHHASRPPPFARRWGQVQHPRGQPSQAAQRGRLVQVSQKRRDRHPGAEPLCVVGWMSGPSPARGQHPRLAHSCGPRACLHRRNPQSTTARGGNARARRPSHWTKPRYSMNSFGQTSEDDGYCSGAGRSSARKARVATTSSPCQGNVGQQATSAGLQFLRAKSAPFAQEPRGYPQHDAT